MSSDEMRVDLESFVNKGIREGWEGWPLKSQMPGSHEGIRSFYYRAAESSHSVLGRAFPEEGRFGQMSGCRLRGFLG